MVSVGGTLKVWETGTVELLGSQINTGSLVVDPAGTFSHEDGTLTVDGGVCDPGKTDPIVEGGTAPGELATVKLINSATASFSGDLTVGDYHHGAVEILSGSTVSNSEGHIGRFTDSDGTVTVDGAGSTWTSSGSLCVGGSDLLARGAGELTVQNGGAVATGATIVGYANGSNGTVRSSWS